MSEQASTSTATTLTFRRPHSTQILLVVLAILSTPWALLLLVGAIVAPFSHEMGVGVGIAFAAFGLALGWGAIVCLRGATASITADANGVTASNLRGSLRLPWDRIAAMRVGPDTSGIEVLLTDGSVVRMQAVTSATRARSDAGPWTADQVVLALMAMHPRNAGVGARGA